MIHDPAVDLPHHGSEPAGSRPAPMIEIRVGDCLEILPSLPAKSVHCCMTSPPYFGLRDYGGGAGEIGREPTPEAFIANLVAVFREVRRVLRDDGTLWVNIADSYAGSWGNQGRKRDRGTQRPVNGPMLQAVHDGRYPATGSKTGSLEKTPGLKNKDLIGIPWRLAFALQADGWYLRQDIIWHKPNPMPESVKDRCTKAHEYLFLLSKSQRYFFDHEAIKEPAITAGQPIKTADGWDTAPGAHGTIHREGREKGRRQGKLQSTKRNKRSVWTVPTRGFALAHFATYPPALIEPCILAGCPKGGTVLDPFLGAGTTALVCGELERRCVGIELNAGYAEIARARIAAVRRLRA